MKEESKDITKNMSKEERKQRDRDSYWIAPFYDVHLIWGEKRRI